MSLEHRPLSSDELPAVAARLVAPSVPVKLRQMAAKGLVPGMSGPDLVCVLYQLSHDSDASVSDLATGTLSHLDEPILKACLDKDLPPQVLDTLARAVHGRSALVELMVLNNAVADETLVRLVSDMNERLTEMVARNEQRLLRYPALIEALYANPNTRMSTASRCVELAVRNGVKLSMGAFREMAQAIGMMPRDEDPMDRALAEAEFDQSFSSIYEETASKEISGEDSEAEAHKHKELLLRIEKLSIPEKVRLAILGNAFHRTVLLRDPNHMVAIAAIKSPKLTELEVVRATKNPQMSEDVLRYIMHRREWLKIYQVKANLAVNPKTPLSLALQLLPHLRPRELKLLSRSKNIPTALRGAAKARLDKKQKLSG
ncbi:MAG: hypothetical protein J7M25_11785 [Deltaproteobacteria bacterium]|nr:hypothetical protein [Deltaproteobacteria bacterium]